MPLTSVYVVTALDPTTCSGGTPYTLLTVYTDKFLSSAGNDICPEAVVAQIAHYLQHGLVNQIGIGTMESPVFGLASQSLTSA